VPGSNGTVVVGAGVAGWTRIFWVSPRHGRYARETPRPASSAGGAIGSGSGGVGSATTAGAGFHSAHTRARHVGLGADFSTGGESGGSGGSVGTGATPVVGGGGFGVGVVGCAAGPACSHADSERRRARVVQ